MTVVPAEGVIQRLAHASLSWENKYSSKKCNTTHMHNRDEMPAPLEAGVGCSMYKHACYSL